MAEPRTERDIIAEFQQRRQRLQDTWSKITEMAGELSEHELVIRTLEPMDKERKCFRMVGDVLVERTVGETLPAVVKNKEGLESVIKSFQETAKKQEADLSEFQAKYKIKIKSGQDDDEEEQAAPSSSQPSSSSQGVLVAKK